MFVVVVLLERRFQRRHRAAALAAARFEDWEAGAAGAGRDGASNNNYDDYHGAVEAATPAGYGEGKGHGGSNKHHFYRLREDASSPSSSPNESCPAISEEAEEVDEQEGDEVESALKETVVADDYPARMPSPVYLPSGMWKAEKNKAAGLPALKLPQKRHETLGAQEKGDGDDGAVQQQQQQRPRPRMLLLWRWSRLCPRRNKSWRPSARSSLAVEVATPACARFGGYNKYGDDGSLSSGGNGSGGGGGGGDGEDGYGAEGGCGGGRGGAWPYAFSRQSTLVAEPSSVREVDPAHIV